MNTKPVFRYMVLFYIFAFPGVSSYAANIEIPRGDYLDGGNSRVAVILCPGRGYTAEEMVAQPLSKAIHSEFGYHTLMLDTPQSLEMDWDEHIDNFPEAYRRIQAAIDYFTKRRQVDRIYLMGHSMGSRMATAYIARYPDAGVTGFIGVGIRAGGPVPLNSNKNLRNIRIPVLDVFGDGGDGKDARHAAYRADMVSDRYSQILIPGADHKFSRHRQEMLSVVLSWLSRQEGAHE